MLCYFCRDQKVTLSFTLKLWYFQVYQFWKEKFLYYILRLLKIRLALMLDLWPLSGSNDLHRSLRKASTQQSIEVPDRILNNKRRETSGDIGITSGKDTVFEKKSCIYVGCLAILATFWHFLQHFANFCQGLPDFRFLGPIWPYFHNRSHFLARPSHKPP